ncbi:quinone oxidoreductase family protein [Paraburkholderia strydomiana]|uniref:quinone oxidoreductase family protein n=1 Tax=Paraburkholderia strydomiana TaxID=1245417 RepID=UPI0038B953A6
MWHEGELKLTQMMNAAVATDNGLELRQIARPVPVAGQILVRVAAAGMNRADLNAARGAGVASKDSLGKPIGMEWAGEIVEIGEQVEGFKPGDLVMCTGSGGYAEFAVAVAGRALKLDRGFDLQRAATLPLALMTAHDAVMSNGRLQKGDVVLVQGASSAVGLMALQIAKLKGAGIVAGTSTNAERRSKLSDFGATHTYDPTDSAWMGELMDASSNKGVDLTIDMVSGASVDSSMKVAAVRGRIINVGRLGGESATFDFDLHAAKRLQYIGVTFRTRTVAEVLEIVSRMKTDLWADVSAGKLRLPIDRQFSLSEAPSAHSYMAANKHFGKIVLIP